jgi:hypothetical protein
MKKTIGEQISIHSLLKELLAPVDVLINLSQ